MIMVSVNAPVVSSTPHAEIAPSLPLMHAAFVLAGLLITRVVGRSIRNNKNYYYLDDGVYGDFSGLMFDHSVFDFKALKKTPKYLSVLAGPTCDSIDTIAVNVELPELEVGDVVYVPNIGAYSCASAMAFNGIPPAKVIVV